MLLNPLVWVGISSLSAFIAYRAEVVAGNAANYWIFWRLYFPWWVHWIWLTPLVVASIDLIPFKKLSKWRFFYLNMSLTIIGMFVNWFFTLLTDMFIKGKGYSLDLFLQGVRFIFSSPFHLDFIICLCIVLIGHLRSFNKRIHVEELRSRNLAHQLVQSELDTLKSQLNPHFLFNTLNSIASLIRQDKKPNALTALSELSLMLRKVLENQNSQMISLAQELEFIESYLAIQQMRFVNRLETKVKVEEDCLPLDFPFMLLQPLVENAIHHGVQSGSDKTLVQLLIRKHEQYLEIRLLNKIPEQEQKKGFGIGLSNCRKRLQWLYDDNFRLELKPDVDGYFETFLSIPVGDDD